MTNNEARILDHTTIVQSTDLVLDWCGEMVPRTVTIEGIVFTMTDPMAGYVNEERMESLYLEGTDDGTEFWYAQSDPIV